SNQDDDARSDQERNAERRVVETYALAERAQPAEDDGDDERRGQQLPREATAQPVAREQRDHACGGLRAEQAHAERDESERREERHRGQVYRAVGDAVGVTDEREPGDGQQEKDERLRYLERTPQVAEQERRTRQQEAER